MGRWLKTLTGLLLLTFLLGCEQVSFERIDRRGHVLIKRDAGAYCFKVPTDWEIRENLEGADVVCIGPLEDGKFRESVVAKSVSSSKVEHPEQIFSSVKEELGDRVQVKEPYSEPDKPVVVTLSDPALSQQELAQFLFFHVTEDGRGIMFTCTTRAEKLESRREFFSDIVEKAHYSLKDCPGAGGVPDTFPTPEVTFTPGP